MCVTGKVVYENHAAARTALAYAQLRRPPEEKKEKRFYKCPLCPGWHLTSRNR